MTQEEILKLTTAVVTQYDRVVKPVTEEIEIIETMLPCTKEFSLRTKIFRPVHFDRALPTIVVRCCYPEQEDWLEVQMKELAKRGFAGVLQWCRGKNGSQGTWAPYFYERNDGMTLVNWLQEQVWVASIGLMGASYLALVGWAMADIVPSKFKTMYLLVLGTEWHESLWSDGAFRQDVYTAWLMYEGTENPNLDYMKSAKYRPQIDVDVNVWGKRVDVYRDFVSHPSPSDPFWTEGFWGELLKVPSRMQIPVFIGEGWFDIHLQNMLKTYSDLSEVSKRHSVVQVNPGNHPRVPVIPGQKNQTHAQVAEYEQQLRWFNEILVHDNLPETTINYYLIGADEWRSYKEWPVPVSNHEEWYLDGEKLRTEAPDNITVREYDYDPDDPVISHGSGTLFHEYQGVGSLQQPEVNYRSDVLSYVSEPVGENLDIIGSIRAELFIESSAPDTCFTFKVMEVREDGTAWNIRDGISTLGYQEHSKVKRKYEGGITKVVISSWDIAYRVPQGSRIRVDISSSNFPEYSAFTNTEKDWCYEAVAQTAQQKIYAGGEYPSKIVLPIA